MSTKPENLCSPQEWAVRNHNEIQKFLDFTTRDPDLITDRVKATICQFLLNTRQGFSEVAAKNGGNWLNEEQIINVQIAELRRCIVDLQAVLTENREIQ